VSSADWGSFGASVEANTTRECSVHFYAEFRFFVQIVVLYSGGCVIVVCSWCCVDVLSEFGYFIALPYGHFVVALVR